MSKSTNPKDPAVLRGISYARISTIHQNLGTDGNFRNDGSPEVQNQRCRDHAEWLTKTSGRKYELIEQLTEIKSAKDTSRPQYQRMLSLIKNRQINFVIATELSRLSRNTRDFLELVELCRTHQVDLIIIDLQAMQGGSPEIRTMLLALFATLAEFERQMTSKRLKQNAYSRFVKDGKINGASEILGLKKDPKRTGHFARDDKGVRIVIKLLNLYLSCSSKKDVLNQASLKGITNLDGKPITPHQLDTILANIPWRYRGKWRINERNRELDQATLDDQDRYREVNLDHGPILPESLLTAVEGKIRDTKITKKKVGKDNFVYILSNILVAPDGSAYSGELAKSGKYRYYRNTKTKSRVDAPTIHKKVIQTLKEKLETDEQFEILLDKARDNLKKSVSGVELELQEKLDEQRIVMKQREGVRADLNNPEIRKMPNILTLSEETLAKLNQRLLELQRDIERLEVRRGQVISQETIDHTKKTVQASLAGFEKLTGTEQRTFIEGLVSKVIFNHETGDAEIVFRFGSSGVTLRNDGSESDGNGGAEGTRTLDLLRDRQAF